MENQQASLIIERAEYRQWSFTLRRTNLKMGLPTEEVYNVHIENRLRNTDVKLEEHVFEQTGGLHMHGILSIPKWFNMKKFRIRGWKMHLEEIWDVNGWRAYMAKEQILNNDKSSPVAVATPPLCYS